MPEIASALRQYTLTEAFKTGAICDLYRGYYMTGSRKNDVLFKVVCNQLDADLLAREKSALDRLQQRLPADTWAKAVPRVIDEFSNFNGRSANVLEPIFDGFLTAAEVNARVPAGVGAKTLVWMWKRLLILLDWSHKSGWTHGSVLPPHLLFYPDNNGQTGFDERKHSVRLVDWCYSIPIGVGITKLGAWMPEWEDFYPPEVQARRVGPWTDVYMAAKCMQYLAGGDVKTNDFPVSIPLIIASEIQEALITDIQRRPSDLVAYHERFSNVTKNAFGEPKWNNFNVPEEQDASR